MAKIKSAFFCQNCGTESAKWVGKCPGCNEWNTLVEEVVQKENKTSLPAMLAQENLGERSARVTFTKIKIQSKRNL